MSRLLDKGNGVPGSCFDLLIEPLWKLLKDTLTFEIDVVWDVSSISTLKCLICGVPMITLWSQITIWKKKVLIKLSGHWKPTVGRSDNQIGTLRDGLRALSRLEEKTFQLTFLSKQFLWSLCLPYLFSLFFFSVRIFFFE